MATAHRKEHCILSMIITGNDSLTKIVSYKMLLVKLICFVSRITHLCFCSFFISSNVRLKKSLGRSKCVARGDGLNTCRFLSTLAVRGCADVSNSL